MTMMIRKDFNKNYLINNASLNLQRGIINYTQLNNVFRIGYVTHFVEDEAQNAGDALASASICNEVIS
jgi:hypothetical protein